MVQNIQKIFGDFIRKKEFPYLTSIFVLTLVVYLFTLAPTIIFGDCPEIATSVFLLGVAHPTGFPTYMILGKLFSLLIPVGEFAYKLNIFSALISSLNAVFVYLILRTIGRERKISFVSACLYAFGRTVWFHATYAQVYSLAAFFGLAEVYLAFRYVTLQRQNKPGALKILYGIFLLAGLGLGVHLTSMFFSLGAIVLILLEDRDYDELRPKLARGLVFFGIGLSVFLYLPLRASQQPPLNWNNPSNLTNFIYYISQRQWSYMMFNRGLYQLGIFAERLLEYFGNEFTPVMFVLACAGIYFSFQANRKLFYTLSALAVSNVLFFSIYGDQSNLEVLFRYFLPVYFVLIVFFSFSLSKGWTYVRRRFVSYRYSVLINTIPFFILPFCVLGYNYSASSNRGNSFALDHARNLLRTASAKDTLILQTEDDIFPLLYVRYVLKEGKDVIIYDRSGNVFGEAYKMDSQLSEKLKYVNSLDYDRWKYLKDLELVSRAPGRVYFADTSNPNFKFRANGLLFQETGESTKSAVLTTDELYGRYTIPDIRTMNRSYKNREEYARYLLMKARGYLEDGQKDKVEPLVHEVASVAGDVWYAMEYASYLYSALGKDQQAIDTLVKTTENIKHLASPYYDLGLLYVKTKNIPLAKESYRQALTIEPKLTKAKEALDNLSFYQPDSPLVKSIPEIEKAVLTVPKGKQASSLYMNLGIAYGQTGDTEKAVENFRKAIEEDDKNPEAHLNLGNAYMNLLPPKVLDAKEEFESVIKLNSAIPITYLNLGSLCAYKLLDYKCALSNWRRYLEKQPDAPEAQNITAEIDRMQSLIGQDSSSSGSVLPEIGE